MPYKSIHLKKYSHYIKISSAAPLYPGAIFKSMLKVVLLKAFMIALVSVQFLVSGQIYATSTDAVWSYALWKTPGTSDIVVAQNNTAGEIYTDGYGGGYWLALRYNPITRSYDQVYVSTFYSSIIIGIKAMDVNADSRLEIVIAASDGQIQIFDQATRVLQQAVSTSASNATDVDIADIDADGMYEIVFCTSSSLYVYSMGGQLKWNLSGVGGSELVVAQMDSDSALEIATTDGHVVDGVTHAIQWTYSSGFGQKLAAADIDADGIAELIAAQRWELIWVYDVDLQAAKWSIDTNEEIGAILVADIDQDGHPEILEGPAQSGSIHAYDSVTRQQKWSVRPVNRSVSEVTDIAIGDADNDGNIELLWGDNPNLSIADWQNNQIKWQNLVLAANLIGPEIGDLDGDGREEIVLLTGGSDWYGDEGRILVFDAINRNLRGISSLVMGGANYNGVHDLKLRDVNGDGRLDILIAGDKQYDGVIEIYSFDVANTFNLLWTSTAYKPSMAYFQTLEAADIDDDQQIEVIAGADRYLYVYSLLPDPLPLQWKSPDLHGYPIALAIADIDQDGAKEIITMLNDGDVYIFSGLGIAKELKAIITGPFTAMRVQKVGGALSIILAKDTGELLIYRFSSGYYVEAYRKQLANSRIGGFTIDSKDRIWVSTLENGSGTLREMLLDGTILASYSGYGYTYFGLRIAISPSARFFYAAGMYSLNAFPLPGASKCSTDLDRDGQSNLLVWRQSSGVWYGLSSNTPGGYTGDQWGLTSDKPVAGDYDGDGKTDIAVWRPDTGVWYILPSNSPGAYASILWGLPADIPVPGDYDGDDKTDIAIWRPDTGVWFVLLSGSPGTYVCIKWGLSTDISVPGDYDGDGKTDVAVWRPDDGIWYVLSSNSPETYTSIPWGLPADIPVPGDYDGDGKTDIAVWSPEGGFWYILQSATPGSYTTMQWGLATDTPLSGDYDGDGKDDIAVWRASTGTWYALLSRNPGTYTDLQWGADGDVPISAITGILRSTP
jgi:hypothetical protein